ncbi:MAG: EAL domain-containing protein, partial [Hyphomicrobiales bacterium]|nr:EAL domain-containing protein [Hyphomicrobiales bacterium]
KIFNHSDASPELLRAKYFVLSKQIPLMYAIVVINMLALAYMHYDKAPAFLTVAIPALIGAVCIFRGLRISLEDHSAFEIAKISKRLRMTTILSVLLGTGIVTWSLSLFGYGDAFTKGQVTFFNGLTVIAVISCLMPLPQVSLILFATVVIPTCIFLALQPEAVYAAIAANLFLVAGAMVAVLWRSHTEFRERIEKQREVNGQRQELETLNDRISLLANEDSLTGLPNRRSFFARLDSLVAKQGTVEFVLGLIDLDGFKPVNDLLGHGAGDKLLREVGRRLKTAMPEGCMIARLGGDEFGFILTGRIDDVRLVELCEALLERLTPVFVLDEGSASVSGTCGVARYPQAGMTGDDLYEKADFALYHSKQNRRGAVTIFSQEHERAIKKVATIGQRLRKANFERDLSLQYQPVVDGRNGATIGFEALARWSDELLGNVPPDVFIRSAEQNGFIGQITLFLLEKAIDTAASWPEHIYLAFNLSAHDLCSPETIEGMVALIERKAFPASRLVFEITETAIIQDYDRAFVSLQALRDRGASIALDDFGTGYSSLSYVRKLPIDRIKIDRSFVLDIEREESAKTIVKAMSDLCRTLNILCIIEGVETNTQLAILSAIGTNHYQGYLFGKPMPSQDIDGHFAATMPNSKSA